MKNSGKQIAVCAVTFALTVALGWLPYVFFVPLLFTCVTRGWKLTLIESLFFGVLSLVYSFAMPSSPVAAAFIEHPWMPIVPRILAGMGCHAVYVGLCKACKNGGRVATVLPVVAACAAGSILNTAIVLPCLLWTGGTMFGDATRAVFTVSTLISGCIELAVAVAVVPPLAITVGRALRLPAYTPAPVISTEKAKAMPQPVISTEANEAEKSDRIAAEETAMPKPVISTTRRDGPKGS